MAQTGDERGEITFWGATAIGIGGMVGGGIFAVLGLAVSLAGGATPVAFLVAGVVALVTAYSYARLSIAYPSRGGTIVFIDRAFGVDPFTGSLNNLLWLSYVVTLSLYAVAFANYAETFFPAGNRLTHHLLISAGILIPALLNVTSAALISRAETYVVVIKIAILIAVIVFGATSIDPARIEPSTWEPALGIAGGGMIIFVAYEGFELIANATPDVVRYRRNVPRAYYTSVLSVIVLYVLIALVTVGSLSADQIAKAQDFALAAAARPSLGQFGFMLVAVSAVLATFSALNATLYGSARLAYTIAEEGELPAFLERKIWNRPIVGLILTTIMALLLANLVDLGSISTMGSGGFLLVFAAVNAANFACAEKTRASRPLAAVGVIACLLALAALVWHAYANAPASLWVLVALVAIAVAVESAFWILLKEPQRRRSSDA